MAETKGNFVSDTEFVKAQKLWQALCEADVPINP